MGESNPHQRFWRPVCYHYTKPLYRETPLRFPVSLFSFRKRRPSISLAPQVISYFGAYTRLTRACSRNGAVDGTRTRTDLLGRQVSYHWTTTAWTDFYRVRNCPERICGIGLSRTSAEDMVPAAGIEPPTQHLTLRARLTVAVRPAALLFPEVSAGLSLHQDTGIYVSVFPRRAHDTKAVGQLHITFPCLVLMDADLKEWYKKRTRLRHLLVSF